MAEAELGHAEKLVITLVDRLIDQAGGYMETDPKTNEAKVLARLLTRIAQAIQFPILRSLVEKTGVMAIGWANHEPKEAGRLLGELKALLASYDAVGRGP